MIKEAGCFVILVSVLIGAGCRSVGVDSKNLTITTWKEIRTEPERLDGGIIKVEGTYVYKTNQVGLFEYASDDSLVGPGISIAIPMELGVSSERKRHLSGKKVLVIGTFDLLGPNQGTSLFKARLRNITYLKW